MLMTLAKFEARPGAMPELLELAQSLVECSRTDPGCLDYACYRDITGSDTLLIVGRWTDQHALERHYETARFQQIIGRFAELLVEAPPSVSLYHVVEMDSL